MDLLMFPKGMLFGLSVAAPVGPIAVLTIRRTIGDGFRMGFATGLGAATADATYGLIAALGLTAIMSALTSHADLIRLAGGVMLLVIGLRALLQARSHAGTDARNVADVPSAKSAYMQAVGLTLTNPMTVLVFIALFAGIGIHGEGANNADAAVLVVGVALGSALWWLVLVQLVTRVRHRLSGRAVRLIDLASSFVIAGFGVAAIVATGYAWQ